MTADSTSHDDTALFEAWTQGDRDAGEELIQRHFPTVFRFFRSKVSGDAEDLSQRTFLLCVEHRDRLWNTATFRAFLLGIARKVLLSHFRDRMRDPSLVVFTERSIEQLRSSPSRMVAKREDGQRVWNALQKLPVDFQIAVELFYWEDMSIDEIAGVLETSKGTVKSRLHRARGKLKGDLLPERTPRG